MSAQVGVLPTCADMRNFTAYQKRGSMCSMRGISGTAPVRFDPSPHRFRHAFGHFCTGVVVITALDAGEPVGFACQAFSALSLEPPLVLFCPAKSLFCWPRIARSSYFCVNVLSAEQSQLARIFGTRGVDKFSSVNWSLSPCGGPVLDGVLTWAGCSVLAVHEAGDHYVVIGRVTELGGCETGEPLLYYQGRLGSRLAAGSEISCSQ
jgi:3-hydroxy-9,10-secoandrosta-1,3,5(10)-triene-9,17-dione monooxygenase reductase component